MSTIKTMGAVSVATAMLLSAGVAFAEEAAVTSVSNVEAAAQNTVSAGAPADVEAKAQEQRKTMTPTRAEAEKATREAKERMKAVADERKATAANASAGAPADIEAKARERAKTMTPTRAEAEKATREAKEQMETFRDREKERIKMLNASSTVERTRIMHEETKERVKQEREKVRARLGDVQDKKRQQMAQKLAAQFEELNKTWTDKFAAQLDRYNGMVQKMEARAATAAAQGKDVAVANATIQAAKSVIAVAQAGVVAQAAKVYVPDTSTITTTAATTTPKGQEELTKGLRAAFQTLHTSLFKDLFALRDGPMASARKAVQDALVMLGKVPGVDEKKTATQTSTTTNQ